MMLSRDLKERLSPASLEITEFMEKACLQMKENEMLCPRKL
jgi:hypothetical protein